MTLRDRTYLTVSVRTDHLGLTAEQPICVRTAFERASHHIPLQLQVDLGTSWGFGLRLMAKDYVGKFNFQDATSRDVQGQTSHNWALSAGLRFNF